MSENAAIEIVIKLNHVKSAVLRKLIVPITIRYDQLHVLLQLSFGWTNSYPYRFQARCQKDKEYVGDMDGVSLVEQVLASKAYVYPDLQNDEILYMYASEENWEHIITLKRILTFDEIQDIQVPSCTLSRGENLTEDGQDEKYAFPFDCQKLNDQFALWARAGEQMITADSLGLISGPF